MNDHIDALANALRWAQGDAEGGLRACERFWEWQGPEATGDGPPQIMHAHAALLKIRDYAREALVPLRPLMTFIDD